MRYFPFSLDIEELGALTANTRGGRKWTEEGKKHETTPRLFVDADLSPPCPPTRFSIIFGAFFAFSGRLEGN